VKAETAVCTENFIRIDSFAWISRNRRLARDFERYARTVAAVVRLAMIRIMLKRLTRPSPCS
jgi:transposase